MTHGHRALFDGRPTRVRWRGGLRGNGAARVNPSSPHDQEVEVSRSRRLIALGAAGTLALTTLVAAPATAGGGHHHHPRHSPERFADRVDVDDVWRHLEAFQRIADRNDGNRAALTSGYEESARYVERTLQIGR